MRLSKLPDAIYGLWLALTWTKIFPLEKLKGKRIALVGPASSAFNTNKGDFIDSFDFVVRVNKSPYVVDTGKFDNDIGKRTDILFHSFFENDVSGGGALKFEMYRNQGIKYLINPRNTMGGLRNTFNFYKKYLAKETTYLLPRSLYKKICEPLNGFRPTVGFTALSTILLAVNFKEFYITGFTFYKTPFGAGYRDQIQDPGRAKAFIQEQGLHNIDLEFQAFKAMMKSSGKIVRMDDVLTQIINEG